MRILNYQNALEYRLGEANARVEELEKNLIDAKEILDNAAWNLTKDKWKVWAKMILGMEK